MSKKGQRHTKFIYGLADPRDHAIRYIWQTNDLAVRLRYHTQYSSAFKREAHKAKGRWTQALMAEGLLPCMVVLQAVPWAEADEAERRWIALGSRLGWKLFNLTINPRQLDLLAEERMHSNGSGSD